MYWKQTMIRMKKSTMEGLDVDHNLYLEEGYIIVHVFVEDLSVQLMKCDKGQLYINTQDKATSIIAIVPK